MLTLVDKLLGRCRLLWPKVRHRTPTSTLGAVLVGSSGICVVPVATPTRHQGKVVLPLLDAYNNIITAITMRRGRWAIAAWAPVAVLPSRAHHSNKGRRFRPARPPARLEPAQNAHLSVRDAQVKLNQLGYNVGAPDGQLGCYMVAGIRAFQRDRRLTISGQLDQATINELAK